MAGNICLPIGHGVNLTAPQRPAFARREMGREIRRTVPAGRKADQIAGIVEEIQRSADAGEDLRGEAADHLGKLGLAAHGLEALGHLAHEVDCAAAILQLRRAVNELLVDLCKFLLGAPPNLADLLKRARHLIEGLRYPPDLVSGPDLDLLAPVPVRQGRDPLEQAVKRTIDAPERRERQDRDQQDGQSSAQRHQTGDHHGLTFQDGLAPLQKLPLGRGDLLCDPAELVHQRPALSLPHDLNRR